MITAEVRLVPAPSSEQLAVMRIQLKKIITVLDREVWKRSKE